MRAQLLKSPMPIDPNDPGDTKPLESADLPVPAVSPDHLLVKVSTCGVCHTDLHVVEGELPHPALPLIPGHQIVGIVEQCGERVTRFKPGARVGIFWLHDACGRCEYCQRGQENLCEAARFTGYTAPGGYAEYTTVSEAFALPLPEQFSDAAAAPLLCAGVVGYRSLRLADLQPGERLGLYGYGASADSCIQVATHWGCQVYVFTRNAEHRQLALNRGAVWVGQAQDTPPAKLDRSVLFAPAGWIVPLALAHLRKAGTLCINAIHTSPIPEMPYRLLWEERTIRTVANVTRQDAEAFLPLAASIPIEPDVELFDLKDANRVLRLLKTSQIRGAAVLQI